jgi:transcriptional regulator of acetoin/glycerol metabolism
MTPPKTRPRRRPKPGTAGPRSAGRLQQAIDATVKRELEAALKESNGNVSEAARLLGISRRGMWARIASLGIDHQLFRS